MFEQLFARVTVYLAGVKVITVQCVQSNNRWINPTKDMNTKLAVPV